MCSISRPMRPGTNPDALLHMPTTSLSSRARTFRKARRCFSRQTRLAGAAGLALKGENGGQPADLRRAGRVQLLGFILFKQGDQLRYVLPPASLAALGDSQLKVHETEIVVQVLPPLGGTLQGWLELHGPALPEAAAPYCRTSLRLLPVRAFVRFNRPGSIIEGECRKALAAVDNPGT